MPSWRYGAYQKDGRPCQGVVEADTREQAADRLRSRGLTPTRIDPAVLPRRVEMPGALPRSRAVWLVPLALVLLLLAALGVLLWLDPYGWLPPR